MDEANIHVKEKPKKSIVGWGWSHSSPSKDTGL